MWTKEGNTMTNDNIILSFQDLDIRFTLRGQVLNALWVVYVLV